MIILRTYQAQEKGERLRESGLPILIALASLILGVASEARTRDILLGRKALCQLSYSHKGHMYTRLTQTHITSLQLHDSLLMLLPLCPGSAYQIRTDDYKIEILVA